MDRLCFNTAVAFRSINDVYSVEVKLIIEVGSIYSKIKSLYLPKKLCQFTCNSDDSKFFVIMSFWYIGTSN